jgi:outer membrane murein-binding lipoprotein Lpp
MNRLLVWLAVGLTVAGCTVRTHTAKTEEDSTQVAVRFASESELAERLDATRAHLDSLKSEAGALGGRADHAMQQKIAQLEVEKDSAQVRFERLQQAGKEKWDDVKSGFSVMLDSLDTKIDRTRHDIRGHG